MTTTSTALALQRTVADNAALRMLRADHVAVIAGLLSTHLGRAGTRVATDDLYEVMDADLELLRDHFDLPKTARAYCDDWRGAGYIVRRPAVGARGETLELSPDAFQALRVLEQLDEPRSTVTQSRLISLAQSIRQLAIDTDPDVHRRLEALQDERDRIDAEITRVRTGEVTVLDERTALERATDILLQAQDLPADFAGVRARFETLNHDLRERILKADESDRRVLDDVFRGVDLIEASDEGQTFSGFAALVRDPERSSALEGDLAAVLERGFADTLPVADRRTLRSLVRDLKTSSRDVHLVLTEFARGLRRYVYSQDFQRDRVLRDSLQATLAAAGPAAREVRPTTPLGRDLELSSLRLSTVGELALHDPSDFDTGEVLADAAGAPLDLEALKAVARESEIDFAELIDNVNAELAATSPVTVGEILRRRPATQGLGSVIGLLSLAATQGEVDPYARERLCWRGVDDVHRAAEVGRHLFREPIA
ncbi:DUF3375 domain-containing protein [Janibacter terrae]|uniref:DUF3375 domain-containing protein n=1 Tax=Janibacter terrae TaxID=103817 RepID=UPI0038261AC1